MKVEVNMRAPNGTCKTLVYSVRHVGEAARRAKKERPTWDIVGVSMAGRRKEEDV